MPSDHHIRAIFTARGVRTGTHTCVVRKESRKRAVQHVDIVAAINSFDRTVHIHTFVYETLTNATK